MPTIVVCAPHQIFRPSEIQKFVKRTKSSISTVKISFEVGTLVGLIMLKKNKIISSCSVLHRQVKRTYNIKLEFKYCILIENWTITWILAVLVSFGKVTAIFRFGISFGNKLKKQFRSYLFIQYIYSCTGWMLLPKRYCFISFFMKIFVAMAASIITGTMMTCIYRNNHAG